MRWVRWTLLVQLVFFGAWAANEEFRRQGPVILLETAPVDPRDLWSGQYLQLSYRISRLESVRITGALPEGTGTPVGIFLEPRPGSLGSRGVTVWHAVEVAYPVPAIPRRQDPAKGVWVVGKFSPRRWGGIGWVEYGIERWYFNEARVKEYAHLRAGSFLAECSVDRDGRLALLRLVE